MVVAHSIGGVVGLEVAKRLGDQAAGFMGVCASIPRPGDSYATALPFPQKLILPLLLKLAGTKPPESAIRSSLCNGLDQAQTDSIVAAFQPESVQLYTDKTTTNPLPSLPTFYVKTLQDKQFSSSAQDAMAANLPSAQVFTVESGHLPMLSHPSELAGHLSTVISGLEL
jgi:pimeloyl-ACP methyl ester carboxylesterase